MVSWWPGDRSNKDIVGGRNALLRNRATTGTGFVAGAFVLDGSGAFVEVPDDDELNFGTGDFTVELWVRFNTFAGEQVLIEKWNDGISGWTLTKLDGEFGNRVLLLALLDEGSESGFDVYTEPLDIVERTWNHFAAMRQGNMVTTWVNGVIVAEGYSSQNLDLDSSTPLRFGVRTPGEFVADFGYFFLDGLIDEVSIYRRALADGEIETIYDVGSGGKCKQGLPSARFSRGDVSLDGKFNLLDPVTVLFSLFLDGELPSCLDAADADDSGSLDVTDAIYAIQHLFLQGPPPPPPFPDCGRDASDDGLNCGRDAPCD